MVRSGRLTADELRNIDKDTHLIVDLHPEEYWLQAEGTVEYVKQYDTGKIVLGIRGLRGHLTKLMIPSDARTGIRYHGAAAGATDLRVDSVHERL